MGGVRTAGLTAAPLTTVAISANGGVLLCGGEDGDLHAWDATRGPRLWEPVEAHGGLPVRATALTFDGRFALTAGDDGGLTLWDVRRCARVREWPAAHGPAAPALTALAMSQPGHVAVSGDVDGGLRFWSFRPGAAMAPPRPPPLAARRHAARIIATAIDHMGTYALSLARDNTLCLWHLPASSVGKQPSSTAAAAGVQSDRAQESPASADAGSPAQVATASPPTAAPRGSNSPMQPNDALLRGETTFTVTRVDEATAAGSGAGAGADAGFTLPSSDRLPATVDKPSSSADPSSSVHSPSSTPSGICTRARARVAADTSAAAAATTTTPTASLTTETTAVPDPHSPFAIDLAAVLVDGSSRDGRVVSCAISGQQPGLAMAGSHNGRVVCWQVRTKQRHAAWDAHAAQCPVVGCTLSAAGDVAATVGRGDAFASVWSTDNGGRRLYRLGPLPGDYIGVSLAHAHALFAVATRLGSAAVWCPGPARPAPVRLPPVAAAASRGPASATKPAAAAAVVALALSADGALLATVDDTTSGISGALYHAAHADRPRPLVCPIADSHSELSATRAAVAVAPGGVRVAAVRGCHLSLYTPSGVLDVLHEVSDSLTTASLSADGTLLLTGTRAGRLLLWHCGEGGIWCAPPLEYHRDEICAASLSTTGALAVSVDGGESPECILWDLVSSAIIGVLEAGAARPLTATLNAAGSMAAVLYATGTVGIWHTANASLVHMLRLPAATSAEPPIAATHLALSPCGSVLACAAGRSVLLLSTSTRQLLHRFETDAPVDALDLGTRSLARRPSPVPVSREQPGADATAVVNATAVAENPVIRRSAALPEATERDTEARQCCSAAPGQEQAPRLPPPRVAPAIVYSGELSCVIGVVAGGIAFRSEAVLSVQLYDASLARAALDSSASTAPAVDMNGAADTRRGPRSESRAGEQKEGPALASARPFAGRRRQHGPGLEADDFEPGLEPSQAIQ